MQQVIWDVIEPPLRALGLYTPADPTYGRYLIPAWQPEAALNLNPAIRTIQRRLFISPKASYTSTEVEYAEDVKLVPEELNKERRRGGRWVYYKVWEMKDTKGRKGEGVDVIMTHGLNDYGGRWAPHCLPFLEAGFRLIVPDLPTYGRSTGVHSHLQDPHQLTAAMHAVLQDVIKGDVAQGRKQRRVFLTGSSMGGWTSLYYLISYPPSGSTEKILAPTNEPIGTEHKSTEYRPIIAGAFILCPAVGVAPETRPHFIIEMIARVIVKIAGTLPLTHAVKGNASDDPRVEIEHMADPMTYHGRLRPSTGLSLLAGMTELEKHPEKITVPIRIIQGDRDRVTDYKSTLKFFGRIASKDKEIEIYPGYEHVMNKVGIDEEDDKKRQAVLKDWIGWLTSRATQPPAEG